jgi:hypothetical protein
VILKVFPGNKLKLVGGLLLAGAMLAMLSACSSVTETPDSASAGQQNTSPGLHIELHADRFEFTSSEQFCQTLFTAEALVGSHGAARWNTADGKLPAGVTTYAAVIHQNLRIYTPITFTRLAPLLDHRHVTTKEFLTVGGHYLVVLWPSTPQTGGNTEERLVVGNTYPIDAQGIVTLQQAGDPNEPGSGQRDPAITVPLASLKQQLANCKA